MEKSYLFLIRFTLILLVDIYLKYTDAVLMRCPYYQINFQKIIGYRPSRSFLTPFHLNDLNNENNNSISTKTSLDLLNLNCWKICHNNEDCMGYVYLMDEQKCYEFKNVNKSIKYETIQKNIDLVLDENAIYFEKTCLNVPDNCKGKFWPIIKIPGSKLIYQGKKMVKSLVTKRECAERCIFETEFTCLSATFTPSYKNNQARFSDVISSGEILGSCVLNDKDKNQSPDSYKSGLIDEEYIENQCVAKPIENINCSYELYSNSTFIIPEIRYDGLTQKQCQENCSKEIRFHCQGASFIQYETDDRKSQCYLHSENFISIGSKALKLKENSIYLRRVNCLNVSVQCTNDEMVIKFVTRDWFRGKLYVNSHSEDCFAEGNGMNTILRLPIGTEQKESQCGILRAYEVTPSYKRTFISTLLVVQYNANVQTQGDRIIKVGCIITSTDNKLPNALALEAVTVSPPEKDFQETERTPRQEQIFLNTTTNRTSAISMQIIDLNKQFETNDVQIGQNLEFRIIESPIDKYYDFKVSSLIAKSNGQIFHLIDKNGCPTDPAIFPQLDEIIDNNRKILRAKFNAFKFAGSSLVSFDAVLQFCLMECPSSNCENPIGTDLLGRRRKRRDDIDNNDNENENIAFDQAIQVQNSLYVTSIGEKRKLEGNGTELLAKIEVPLSLNLSVHGQPLWDGKEGMVYGDNGLVINPLKPENTMYSSPGTICINTSLLVALIIFGIIFQIALLFGCWYLILKYKKIAEMNEDRKSLQTIHEHLQYIDNNRRVHWGDSSNFAF
ncbi:uncharacterized protein LOC129607108 [Condylostylus longicornis]|uniref:uncharacterized protein LOC129607108 n=1 Tax=Condylostylus longicornis TaxID=2530218 RepID=UPI00244E2BAD|nr:uncharacterized protein LOC129607108 [Condylostylus longicornis]